MEMKQDDLERLAKAPLFKGLSSVALGEVAREMTVRSYAADQQIFALGARGDAIFYVVSGRVRLSTFSADGRALSFRHVEKGGVFGEIAALDCGERTAEATALVRTELAQLARAPLQRLIADNPGVAQAAIMFLCSKLRESSKQLGDLVFLRVDVRLARFLLESLDAAARKTTAPITDVNLPVTQGELAALLGATRQTINSAFADLERCGAIKRQASSLRCNRDILARVAACG